MTKRTHWVAVKIECQDSQTVRDARQRVLHWLETFGHTAPSHGFEFLEIRGAVSEPGPWKEGA